MASKAVWFWYAVKYTLRKKVKWWYDHTGYAKCPTLDNETASKKVIEALHSGKPFMAGRIGLFELAVMRMYEFGKKNKYELTMNNLYNCAGFFPNDILLGEEFLRVQIDALKQCDILGRSGDLCEDYFVDHYMHKGAVLSENFDLYHVCSLKDPWSKALAGKKVLVVTPFADSVRIQYEKRELLFGNSGLLPEMDIKVFRSLLTIGDLRDERFATWFEALDFMKKEILAEDFDVALLGCGAYGFPLAAEIKKAGKQAIHMGGVLQILFGIMGRRWDGSRWGGPDKMDTYVKPYYNEHWIYPVEERPGEAGKVEYGPYWK